MVLKNVIHLSFGLNLFFTINTYLLCKHLCEPINYSLYDFYLPDEIDTNGSKSS